MKMILIAVLIMFNYGMKNKDVFCKSIITPPEEPKLLKGDSAFDEIAVFNNVVDVERNHPPGFHLKEGDIMEQDSNMVPSSSFQKTPITDDPKLPVNSGIFFGIPQQISLGKIKNPAEQEKGSKRASVRNDLRLWRTRTIPYVIDPLRVSAKVEIENGMREISSQTCLRFVQRTNEEDYLNFIKGTGCWSTIGMKGGPQEISIGSGCERKETVVHEILHALGRYHEQNSIERDKYVKIKWQNIIPENFKEFQERNAFEMSDLNLPYDMKSVMHYGNLAFSKNGKKTIISNKYPGLKLGNDKGLSAGDVDEIKKLYHCDELPIGGFGPWNEWLPCFDNVKIKYRSCYGQTQDVCEGPGVQNGVQALREICSPEPIRAFMEGCFNHDVSLNNRLPLKKQATDYACGSFQIQNKDFFDFNQKITTAFRICARSAMIDGFKKFGITDYCHCHYGNDDIDLKQNGRSKWCSDGYGIKDSLYLYILGSKADV